MRKHNIIGLNALSFWPGNFFLLNFENKWRGSEKSNFLFFDNISVFIGKILKDKNIILKFIVKWSLNIHTENANGIRNNNKERKNWKRKWLKECRLRKKGRHRRKEKKKKKKENSNESLDFCVTLSIFC